MAKNMVKAFINHPVVELTRVQAVKDGHHFTQYKITSGVGTIENGILVSADHVAGEVKKASAITEKVYLHASVEHMYNGEGRDQFVVKETDDFLPRIYEMQVGDTFETNAVVFDDTATTGFAPAKTIANIHADVTTKLGSAPVYATVCVETGSTGYIELVSADPTTAGVKLQVVKVVTLPNGTKGFKFVVVK
jgi:hypothetical protein